MSSKRPASPALIPNPFIKKRNLEWTLESPSPNKISSSKDIRPRTTPSPSPSPPPEHDDHDSPQPVTTSAIEAGQAVITDHLAHFTVELSKHVSPSPRDTPLLPVLSYAALYTASDGSAQGAHFVVHQHDHPVAGTHYDLRLQINESSSVSWAIMYGLPGDPNSVRLNRNATETRIHCLWVSECNSPVVMHTYTHKQEQNHLVETASKDTGSLLIWDMGTYSVLPRQSKHAPAHDPSSPPSSPPSSSSSPPSQQALLHAAFQARKIRLRLHGTRLPDPYVLSLRLTKTEDASGRARSARGRRRTPRRRRRGGKMPRPPQPETSSDEDPVGGNGGEEEEEVEEAAVVVPSGAGGDEEWAAAKSALEREVRELEDEEVRRTNAYPGAANTIGSVHQRRWYLSLDRPACGFAEARRGGRAVWERGVADADGSLSGSQGDESGGEAWARLSYPFYVRGADHERSVVTGRTGEDILRDEGVADYVGRKGWKPVLN